MHLTWQGLEWDNVFVVRMNEGDMPVVGAAEGEGSAGIEEERRLCYVALSRARKQLQVRVRVGVPARCRTLPIWTMP